MQEESALVALLPFLYNHLGELNTGKELGGHLTLIFVGINDENKYNITNFVEISLIGSSMLK